MKTYVPGGVLASVTGGLATIGLDASPRGARTPETQGSGTPDLASWWPSLTQSDSPTLMPRSALFGASEEKAVGCHSFSNLCLTGKTETWDELKMEKFLSFMTLIRSRILVKWCPQLVSLKHLSKDTGERNFPAQMKPKCKGGNS